MGRWAQRRRYGGGPATVASMVTAVLQGSLTEILITFSSNVDAAYFPSDFFIVNPSLDSSITINQAGPRALLVDWGLNLTGTTTVTNEIQKPGVVNDQVLAVT